MKMSLAALFLALGASVAHADDAEQLLRFAKANAGKFASEVKAMPSSTRLRLSKWSWSAALPTFNQAKQQLVLEYPGSINSPWVFQRCVGAGSFEGRNAFGASVRVQQQRCERLALDSESFSMANHRCPENALLNDAAITGGDRDAGCSGLASKTLVVPMTADMYRKVKQDGFVVEVAFVVGEGADQEVVEAGSTIGSATIKDPVERQVKYWNVRGAIKAVRLYAPDGKTTLATIQHETP